LPGIVSVKELFDSYLPSQMNEYADNTNASLVPSLFGAHRRTTELGLLKAPGFALSSYPKAWLDLKRLQKQSNYKNTDLSHA
jgi:hypothetical protein